MTVEEGSGGAQDLAITPRRRMSTTQRLLLFSTAWLICLMPFLFWWSTSLGRPLSYQQLNEYLKDNKNPPKTQHEMLWISTLRLPVSTTHS